MGLNCTQGFIVNEIKSRRIKTEDAKKYGIGSSDWQKSDINKNGEIDGDEFIKSGLSSIKLFQAFKGLSGDSYDSKFANNTFKNKEDAINFKKSGNADNLQNPQNSKNVNNSQSLQKPQTVKSTNPAQRKVVGPKGKTEPFKDMTKSIFSFANNHQYSLIHPNITGNNTIAKKFDFLA